jgi:L-ascorbate metabolism protein UlaG (beta-lactamase superfamily)
MTRCSTPARRQPARAGPTRADRPARFATPPATGLRVTWLGHAATLVEIDGHRVLTDPVWSERASPYAGSGRSAGTRRASRSPTLPPLDAVVISHDHYDHLDPPDDHRMQGTGPTDVVVPLGSARTCVLGRAGVAHRRAGLVGAHEACAT